MKKTLIILFALLSALQVSWGQGRIEVRGKVTASDNGEPLPGVAVSIGNNYGLQRRLFNSCRTGFNPEV